MAHSDKRGKAFPADGSRSPTAHRTKSQAASHWADYGSKHKEANRARTQARRTAIKEGRVKRGDGKDVHHKKPLAKGGSNAASNIKIVAASKNRAQKGRQNAKSKR